MSCRSPRCFAVVWFVLGCVAAALRAHDPGISVVQGQIAGERVALATGFAPADVAQLLPPDVRGSGRLSAEDFEAAREPLARIARELWELQVGETAVPPLESRAEYVAGDNVTFHTVFSLPPGARKLTLRAPKMPELPSGHRQFVIVSDARGSALTKKMLRGDATTLDLSLDEPAAAGAKPEEAATEAPPPTWWEFLKLGVEHIWTGYDHLLFLFALLIVCRTFRSIVTIVSCFTVAHSITLAVATLGWVDLNSRFVEAAIAASIVFVGVENLWRRGEEPRGRWALTFAFGLIHGFGFASVLSDLGVGRGGGIAGPLLMFNLGVELGQIVIAAVVLPLVWQLRKRPWFVPHGVTVLSSIVVVAGSWWLLQRTVIE